MRELLVDSTLVIFGVLASRVIFTSLYKPSAAAAKLFSYVVGAVIAAFFYFTWARTGLDPVQLAICTAFEDAPVCIEKRVLSKSNAAPPERQLVPVAAPAVAAPKIIQSIPSFSAPTLFPRCAGNPQYDKCIREELRLQSETPAQADRRRFELDRSRAASMAIVNSTATRTLVDQLNSNPLSLSRCAGSYEYDKCVRDELRLQTETPQEAARRRKELERSRAASMKIVNAGPETDP